MKLFNNTKKIVLSKGIAAVVGCLLFSGCTDNNSSVTSEFEVLEPSFRTSLDIKSKGLTNSTGATAAGDVINLVGVYITKDNHNDYLSITDRTSVWEFADSKWTSTSTISLSANKGLMYAYSPAGSTVIEGAEGTDLHTIDVTVGKDQTYNGVNAWQCSGVDYLYGLSTKNLADAKVVEIHNRNHTPSIFLHHALAQVVFKMQSAAGRAQNTTYDYIKSVTISSETETLFKSGSGAMLLKNGTIESLTSVNELKFSPLSTTSPVICGATGTPSVVAYGLVAPTDLSGAVEITVTIVLGKIDSDTEDRTLSVSHENFKQLWTKGNKYIYNLTLGDRKIEVTSTSIGSWTDLNEAGDMNPNGF